MMWYAGHSNQLEELQHAFSRRQQSITAALLTYDINVDHTALSQIYFAGSKVKDFVENSSKHSNIRSRVHEDSSVDISCEECRR